MPPKKRRQRNNKENLPNPKLNSISIQPIIEENLKQFENEFNKEAKEYETQIQKKLAVIHQEFDKYLQTHASQEKLARLIDEEIRRINQQQQINGPAMSQCQELLDKTNDLMNASALDSSRTKTYLIGELQILPFGNGHK